jgi:hypothetical protein
VERESIVNVRGKTTTLRGERRRRREKKKGVIQYISIMVIKN